MNPVLETTDLLLGHIQKEHLFWTSRGTTAIYITLKTISEKNYVVIVPNNVCLSVIAAILFSGNLPLPLDIDLGSQSISISALESIGKLENVIVIYPYMYGICHPDILKVKSFCEERGWFLIEDCAQSLGGKINNKNIGSFGDVAVFSFGAGKIIDCSHGGAIATNDSKLIDEFGKIHSEIKLKGMENKKKERVYGEIFKSLYTIGENNREIDLSKMFLTLLESFKDIFIYKSKDLPFERIRNGLLDLNQNLKMRLENVMILKQKFDSINLKYLEHPKGSTYWRLNIIVPPAKRNNLLDGLHKKGFHASSWFPSVDRFYRRRTSIEDALFPNCDSVGNTIINLWVNDQIDKNYVNNVSSFIINFLQ